MKTMIREIYMERYGKVVLLLMALLIAIPFFSGMSTVSGWHAQNDYYHSKEFIDDYNAYPENYAKDYHFDEATQQETTTLYDSIADFREGNLDFYVGSMDKYLPTYQEQRDNRFTIYSDASQQPEHGTYQRGVIYFSNWEYSQTASLIIFAMFVIGFLLFFIDQKTNFNRFLFSLPVKRHSLFRSKLTLVVAPMLASLFVGVLMNRLVVFLRIPHESLQATLPQLLYSGLSYFVLAATFLAVGIFFGNLLGNLVSGPLVSAIGLYILAMSVYNFYDGLNNVITYFFPTVHFFQLWGLLITQPGKTGSPIWMLVALLVFSLVLLWMAERLYQRVSMEHDGEFVLVPKVKLITALALFIGWNLYFTVGNIFSSIFFTGYSTSKEDILWILIQILLVFLVSFGLVYTGDLRKRWLSRRA